MKQAQVQKPANGSQPGAIASARRGWPGLLGLATYLLVGYAAVVWQWPLVEGALAAVGGLAIVIFVAELTIARAHLRETTELDWQRAGRFAPARVATKLVGFAGSLTFLAALYWLLPEYHGSFYAQVWEAVWQFGPYAVLVTAIYIAWIDRYMQAPKDGLYAAGRFILTLGRKRDLVALKALALALIVKGFFTPLMFVYLCGNLESLQQLATEVVWNKSEWFELAWISLFSIDVGFATAGYLCSFRLIDTHIRSCDPTPGGWVVALICYQPFWSLVTASYIYYARPWAWGSLLWAHPTAYLSMAVVILVLVTLYVWATVCFGLRFSNLTYRGTVSWGPYRWTKHPAYLCKNTSWWLIALPFLPFAGIATAIQASALLLLNNLIYYLRAKTEERHLLAYPEYRAYAQWIDQHGALARCRKIRGQYT